MNLDDPKLTAYVLGELTTEERAEIEAALAESPKLRAEVDALQNTAKQVDVALASEKEPSLSSSQSRALAQAMNPKLEKTRPFSLARWILWGGVTACCAVVLAGVFLPALSKAKSRSSRVAALNAARLAQVERELDDSTEEYSKISPSDWISSKESPLSTFSIDVDTASYSNVRRFLNGGSLPPSDAVRIEELLNYFRYDYPQPKGSDPFSVNVEVGSAPWASAHRLVRIGLKAKDVSLEKRPRANLVFLVDVSGSMEQENKLPLVKRSLKLLVDQMGENDSIAMVTYAGNAGIALQPTSAANRDSIKRVIDRLEAGGSTHGSAGIQAAYELALQRFVKGGINRVLLCTDGDFNVGVTTDSDLLGLITEKAKSGVFLSVLGFGMGNLKDSKLELLADKGNGNYAYIDSFAEARRVFVEQMSGTLQTVAKDVKIQVEFSPAKVQAYRLIGYENRRLAAKDFNNDAKDAGEIGAGHAVTALYEIIPVGVPVAGDSGEPLRYQSDSATETPLPAPKTVRDRALTPTAESELLFVKLRYKQPEADTSSLISLPVTDHGKRFEQASADFRFAAAVAGFGMRLRNSPGSANFPMSEVSKLAEQSLGTKADASRAEFIDLVRAAGRLGR